MEVRMTPVHNMVMGCIILPVQSEQHHASRIGEVYGDSSEIKLWQISYLRQNSVV